MRKDFFSFERAKVQKAKRNYKIEKKYFLHLADGKKVKTYLGFQRS